jgi:hypothetical protein
MKLLGIIILVMLLIPVVLAQSSLSSINVTLIATGGVIANTERSWAESDSSNGFIAGGQQYNEGTTDMVFLTGPGRSRLDFNEETNHSLDNVLDSSIIAQSEGGFAYGHGVYMGDQQPYVPDLECTAGNIAYSDASQTDNSDSTKQTFVKGTNPSHQEVLIEKYGVGQGLYVESDIIAENANVTSSTHGEVYLGHLMEDISTHAEAGFNKTATTLNYEKDERYHLGVFGNESGTGQMAIDFKWRDHSHPYGIGADAGEIYTVNVTEGNVTNST